MEEGVVDVGVLDVDGAEDVETTEVEVEEGGGGVELEEVDGAGSSEEELDVAELEELDDPEESPALKTTSLAVLPFGTVATQKSAPPAPVADSELVTSFMLLTEGSIEQGRPLQSSPSHSIFTPQSITALSQ